MVFDPIYLLYGAVFIGTLLLVEGVYYLMLDLRGGAQNSINRRMRMRAKASDEREVLYSLRRYKDGKHWYNVGPIERLDKLLGSSGMIISIPKMLGVMGMVGVGCYFALAFGIGFPDIAAAALAAVLGPALSVLFVWRHKKARIKKFGEQLPEAIDVMVRSLRAGHPIAAAMSMVAREMADPIGTEFGIAADEMTYGLDLRAALDSMRNRVNLPDLHYMIVAVNIQHGSGGNLAEILSNLSRVIRDRFRMFKKIAALSAEGKLSAVIISILPFAVGGGLHIINPNYYTKNAGEPLFILMMTVGVVGLLIGYYIMYRMVNFRV